MEDITQQERVEKINALARKSKAEGLTPEEGEEQKILRKEYLEVFRQNFIQQLDSIEIVDKT